MTYLIIRQKTYSDKSKGYSVHDQTEDKEIALNKVRGYTLANSESDIKYLQVQVPLVLTNPIKDDRQMDLPFPEVA
jgi:hypothetical protein